MTDEELVKALRDAVNGEHDMTPHGADCLQAAYRIEALTEQLEAARADAKEAEAYAEELEAMNKNQEAMIRQADRRGDALEAKLAKAVEGLDKAAALIEDRHFVHMTSQRRNPKDYISDWSLIAKEVRATLAEIEGSNAP